MASHAELAYTGIVEALAALEREFVLRREGLFASKAVQVYREDFRIGYTMGQNKSKPLPDRGTCGR